MNVYYNETDPYAAQWLRNLIAAGHIAPGVVDERSIEDVKPDELMGFTQCHFFAGIGGWSLALRLAGWPDNRPVWTGSCPCQPFSSAGKRAGFADKRHLWPAWFHLIEQCRPDEIFGEQVASKDGLAWLDLVHSDMGGAGYAIGACDLPAAGVGAPHIRQRLWFVAHAEGGRSGAGLRGNGQVKDRGVIPSDCSSIHELGNASGEGLEGHAGHGGQAQGREEQVGPAPETGDFGGLADTERDGPYREGSNEAEPSSNGQADGLFIGSGKELCGTGRPGPANGLWRDADWLLCWDGKWRPVEPDTWPLAHGVPARVGRLRAYGNAINPYVAAEFIKAYWPTGGQRA